MAAESAAGLGGYAVGSVRLAACNERGAEHAAK